MVEAAIFTPKKLAPLCPSSSSSSSPRSSLPFTPKRSQSVERRRPGTSGTTRTTSSSGKMLPTSAITRSLFVSFPGESFWITVNKAKPTTNVVSPPKLVAPRKSSLDGASSSRGVINSKGQVSFIASPNKVSNALPASSSSSKGVSPLRLGNGASYNEPSVLSFVVDVKRLRVGENRIMEAHSLRLLHNPNETRKQQRFCGE
ncbi:hypothetical protein LR48_Vigan02g115400 [Vigna angularis]|nr:hypothetical protein LR48_Vigan02g115400 [Vigna angularis]BAT95614.1 hypothetical protein VIGAN_08237100 [Vigna angularis var. angularis]